MNHRLFDGLSEGQKSWVRDFLAENGIDAQELADAEVIRIIRERAIAHHADR